ncbi:hypothetical protein ATO6_04930 [Oceanicola sp. 22II-s10i]|uniref:hypothetical protein n=1 Tax=Oceanicola sp. 22II-s10i TaxID=1317116 RepID=UPI000B521803|nr:hypothetical protein [Oceanicola sp. 22II-s10i]OWU86195.1 hypothetical protein ATO6_04930 [Oceanicola sp. 22II-s10i]
MSVALVILPPVLAGLALPFVLRRFAPGSSRAELAVGAPVLMLALDYVWLVIAWLAIFVLVPVLPVEPLTIAPLSTLLTAALAGMVVAPLCALGSALWLSRAGGGAR